MPADAIAWLLTEGPRAKNPGAMLEGFCLKLRKAGLPVERATIGAPLLHPVAQSAYARWTLGRPVENNWFVWSPENEAVMRRSPIGPIYEGGTGSRLRLENPDDRARFPIGEDLAAEGFTEYSAIALPFSDGSFKAFTVATRRPGGFPDAEHAAIIAAVPALALVLEGFVQRNAARTLLDTYIGGRAGGRVLDGQIRRGDGSQIDAVIFFSDIRGFTGLAQRHAPDELLRRLNAYFETVVQAVAGHGGETLKFIGDSVLAIFPLERGGGGLAATVRAAEESALAALSARDRPDWPEDVDFGVALHRGTVFYGNIGGETRLDFTVIGEAVNVANRIEGLCAVTGERFLVSQAIAEASVRPYQFLGDFGLKGVEGKTPIFRLERRRQP